MATNLAEQLQARKRSLKTPSEPTKDYSGLKTGGFVSPEEIKEYEDSVLDINTECWMDQLSDVTFPTVTCPLIMEDANLFLDIYKRLFLNKDAEAAVKLDWISELSETEQDQLETMKTRLGKAMSVFTDEGYAFVKLSSRSAKDAPLLQGRFKELYKAKMAIHNEEKQSQENTKITCLLQAGFDALRVKTADDVIDMFIRSERVYQDLLLAVVNRPEKYHQNFIIKKFVEIEVDMEFRGFVYRGRLNALSQYNYLIYSKNLESKKDNIEKMILDFFYNTVMPKLSGESVPQDFIMDFAVCNTDEPLDHWKLWVIELNPFLSSTDGAMFSWEHERHILTGEDGFTFRIVRKVKPGSLTMLPQSVRGILKET